MKATAENVRPKTMQKINLVDGNFTVSEASDVVLALLNEKINFHKLQRLSLCEGYSEANTKYPDERITELEHEKSIAKDFFAQARAEGLTLKIDGVLKISVNK
ncbi:hypothetical protein BFP77_03480 [Maribacter sp. 4U21]|uniref:hypothetical protein n=1 Tax=Maribacter sp. 4U21 TaxID=1889779 RepID=UPI000C14D435|nr:hypothetical protein [Maribacter sp. 4U21]PIB30849.1 hypothetical protein BFP77_03480 [Maribacter sp. 4U21]